MTQLLLDTHAWAWIVTMPGKISSRVQLFLDQADTVCLSTVSVYEIGQKVRLGKWPEMNGHLDDIESVLVARGGTPIAPGTQICALAGLLDWPHRDPFDRIIAATALSLDLTLISADTVFDALPIRRVW
ncbi:type II toxin-antitoxin system VapC family toxin [Neogemmobacter tilapiae]|uniref:Twitching motility protein PilT n=1 Tax=Neogemmobacter tilapiae TaxID=875041 RepID=A0A918TMI7_9RHOB|nr:type II toxin-antitoxin system VapC family toxin [Gemmobacter tilapiae]GHC54268.1 twitching motility protein PilT [Gemmobacter tilapiae]